MALVLRASAEWSANDHSAAEMRREAEIIEFPGAAVRADAQADYHQPEHGTAEEFYIAHQPFAPQWDWDFREI